MNKKRKKEIRIQILELSMLHYSDEIFQDLDNIKNKLEWIRDEEKKYYKNISKNIEYLEESITILKEAIDSFSEYFKSNDIIDLVRKITNTLEMICE